MDNEEDKAASERQARLNALGEALSVKRKEAIDARRLSGIEDQWIEDQEFYEGIDDANRHEHRGVTGWGSKPTSTPVQKRESATSSVVFPNITAPYCDAAAARVVDTTLPTDDRPWLIDPTPIPDMANVAIGKLPKPMIKQIAADHPGDAAGAQGAITKVIDSAKQIIEDAKERAKKAETRIDDWHGETSWNAEVRKAIKDSSRIGSGVIKGPVPMKMRGIAMVGGEIKISERIIPGSKCISAFNLFPDGACGDNIHNGAYIWEVDYLTAKQVEALKGIEGSIDSQIDEVLKEGPMDAVVLAADPDADAKMKDKHRFQIWYFHGSISREEMESAGCECGESESIPAMLTMINNKVVRAAMNPLDTGDFPYDVIPWRKKAGMPWGDGVARAIRTPQRIVTAGFRAMLVNAGRAAGPMVVIKQGVLAADGSNEITPWKIFTVGEDVADNDVRNAVTAITFPMMQAEMERIIQMGLKLAEDVTGLPMLLQGQQGSAPDTARGTEIVNQNASGLLRGMALVFTDHIKPHLKRYYDWLLQYGEDDEEKGDFQVNVRFTALTERSIQNQEMGQMLQASANPIYGWDPKKAGKEYLKSRKLDPKSFEYDDEEWKKVVEGMSQGKQDPRMAIAQLRAETDAKLIQMEQAFDTAENEKDRQRDLVVASINERMNSTELSSSERQNLEKIKSTLAGTAMKLKVQQDLSVAGHAVDLHKNRTPKPVIAPPTEPAGRAKQGQSFQA